MGKVDIDQLVRRIIRLKNNPLYKGKKHHGLFYVGVFLLFFSISGLIGEVIEYIETKNPIWTLDTKLINKIAVFSLGIGFSYSFWNYGKLENEQKKVFHNKIALFSFFCLNAIFLLHYFNENDLYRFRILGFSGVLIILILVFLINSRPSNFFSSTINNVGLGAIILYIIQGMLFPLSSIITSFNENSFSIIFLILTLVLFLTIIGIVAKFDNRSKLRAFQILSLPFISSEKVVNGAAEMRITLDDKIRAMELLRKLDANEKTEVEIELTKILSNHFESKYRVGWSILFGLILFVISSVGEGFFQDLIYEPIVKPIICNFGLIEC